MIIMVWFLLRKGYAAVLADTHFAMTVKKLSCIAVIMINSIFGI